MRILFLVLFAFFQWIGALGFVQDLVKMAMQTGFIHDPVNAFVGVALAIIAFAALVRFAPGFSSRFTALEQWFKNIFTGQQGTTGGDVSAIAEQIKDLAADVQILKQAVLPAGLVAASSVATANQASLDTMATGQPSASSPAPGTQS